jgi:hypothetical protein
MLRVISFVTPALFFLIAACGGATFGPRPSLSSHVPDSTLVRIAIPGSGLRASGRAVDWQRGTPRVVTTQGDTIVVPEGARLQVQLKGRPNRAVTGGVIGFLAGFATTYARCPNLKARCRMTDPTALLAAGAGALIGSRFKVHDWVTVRRDTLAHESHVH